MNLAWSLLGSAERAGERDALVEGGRRLTHAELLDATRRLAGGLRAAGVAPGDRVAAALRNRTETVLLWWACQWVGAVFVPLNWRLRPEEVLYCVTDAGAVAVAIEEASAAVGAATPSGVASIGVAGASGELSFDGLLAAEPVAEPAVVDDREPALMLYTSGTTGRPKGVPRSHAAERAAAVAHVVQHGYADAERTLGVMPLYHTMGQRSMLAMSLLGGLFALQPQFRPSAALELIEQERLTALYLAPTLFHDLVLAAPDAGADVSSVRKLGYAGAPMTAVLVERVVELFAPDVFVNHYGSTEIYTFTIHGDQRAKPGCAGRAGLNARIRLVGTDPDASPEDVVAPGEVGQVICHLSSDESFSGYWHRPDADARQIRDGWYYPGDLGHLDADGDLFLVGRTDDMIVSGGENVHPVEIEEWLVRHPAVREAAVVGAPDERFGQRVVACVVLASPGAADAQELDRHCLASPTLAAFKRPREYRILDELPKSSSGKILRRVLRDDQATDPGKAAMTHDGFHVAREVASGVATITLDVPEKMNRVSMLARDQLREVFEQLGADDDVRVIVLTGAGDRAFTAGGDIPGFMERSPEELSRLHWNVAAPERCPKPVIARVHGYTFGVGLELALACDFRVAADDVQLALPEITLGMIPGSGGTQRLVRLIGLARAKDLVLRGRRVGAEEALAWGLVTTVVPRADLDRATAELAAELAAAAPLALRMAKRVLDHAAEGDVGLHLEGLAYGLLRSSHDFAEGVAAFTEKRKPVFEGR